jgi:hypothetical protein
MAPTEQEDPDIPIEEFRAGINNYNKLAESSRSTTSARRPADGKAPPAAYSLAQYQTPVRSQRGRATCFAMAAVAAIEAAYKRSYGLDLVLSVQYAFHIEKAGELYPDYATNRVPHENNSSYWGYQGNSGIVQEMQRFALPTEADAPYLSAAAMEALKAATPAAGTLDNNSTQEQFDAFEFSTRNIPTRARQAACYGVTSWELLAPHTPEELERVISEGHEVIADFHRNWKFLRDKNVYDYDPTAHAGGHDMLVVGYDRNAQIFTLKNSKGGTSLINVTYNFVRHCLFAGHYITGVIPPSSAVPQKKAMWIGDWNMDYDGCRGTMVIRRFTNFRASNPNAPTKLGNFYSNGKRHDVNGYFTENGQNMVFCIADTSERIVPGTLTGKLFNTYVFGHDPNNAAGIVGKMASSDTTYGAILSRNVIPGTPSKSFDKGDWVGTWKMNYDGWNGTLMIRGFRATRLPNGALVETVDATYTNSSGSYPVTGTLLQGQPHRLTMFITWAANNQQRFDLNHFTRENGVFAGVTQWHHTYFGVEAYK